MVQTIYWFIREFLGNRNIYWTRVPITVGNTTNVFYPTKKAVRRMTRAKINPDYFSTIKIENLT